uniref:SNRNP25 ubiquitin-like domain-containing protein n=1 Tax=Davidia involucrata TaxID=16924 RepID=A0A5B7C3J6_DAVIN
MVKIMPTIDHNNRNSRVLAPLSLNNALFPRSFSYHKLPPQLLKLSVLKLDGSSFDVHIARSATVSELKIAVEEIFSLSPREDQGKISWSHVWGHFCLCYEGQKLVNDKAYIQTLGIKDGDQLQFVRHMSINYRPEKQQSKNQSVASSQYSMLSLGSNTHEEREQNSANDDNNIEDQENIFRHHEVPNLEFKLAHFLKGWLSYSKLWGAKRKDSEVRTRPSRFSLCLLWRRTQDDSALRMINTNGFE